MAFLVFVRLVSTSTASVGMDFSCLNTLVAIALAFALLIGEPKAVLENKRLISKMQLCFITGLIVCGINNGGCKNPHLHPPSGMDFKL